MSEIRVETGELRSGSNSLNSSGKEISNVGAQVGSIPASVGNAYNGELAKKLEAIIGGNIQFGSQLENRAIDLGRELISRAQGFEAANQAGINSLMSSSSQLINILSNSPLMRALSALFGPKWSKAVFLWAASGLGGGSALISLVTFMLGGRNISNISGSSEISPDISSEKLSRYKGTAYRVTEDNSELNNALKIYKRGANTSTASNCTWYVAAAVYVAHGIKLISYQQKNGQWFKFGNGGEWATNARSAMNDPSNIYHQYIKDVNKIPEAGSVYSDPKMGHVAFVEEATQEINSRGEKVWRITLSEENYPSGDSIPDAHNVSDPEQVNIPNHPEVKRWIRVVEYPRSDDGSAVIPGDFIHITSPSNGSSRQKPDLDYKTSAPSASMK
jgi:surface antigen/uncharacterized protein YukE